MSLALLEAMSCGAAIVATEVSGVEALSDVGSLVPIGDVRGLADAIDRALRSPDLRQRMGGLARERATQGFDVQHTHARYVELWSCLAMDRRRCCSA